MKKSYICTLIACIFLSAHAGIIKRKSNKNLPVVKLGAGETIMIEQYLKKEGALKNFDTFKVEFICKKKAKKTIGSDLDCSLINVE